MDSIRVVTYNILSSHLSGTDHFKHCHPVDLQPETRLSRIKSKLEAEIRDGAVICLQEVSQTWAGPLHAFFQQRHYHFVTALYGGPLSGYMGVGLAWPSDVYEAIEVDIKRLSDTRPWPSPPKPYMLVRVACKTGAFFTGVWLQCLRLLGIDKEAPYDPWAVARERSNELIFARLRHRQTTSTFCIATYHMPCLYGSAKKRQTMVIHASLAMQYVQEKAGDDPFIFAGDFNIKPGDTAYHLLTEGKLDVTHEDFPQPKVEDDTGWDTNHVKQLRSMYVVKNGKEPDFTNNARVGDEPLFTTTLDYIFLSAQWSVEDIVQLASRDAIDGPFPNAAEPSDHVLIGANVSLKTPPSKRARIQRHSYDTSTEGT